MMAVNKTGNYASGGRSFSLRRVFDFGMFYWPRLRYQVLIYLIVSIVCGGLTLIPAPGFVQTGLHVAVWTLIPMIYFCGPLIFAKGPDIRIVERLIPVSAAEKMVFYYFYILIVMGLCCCLFPDIAMVIYKNCPAIQTPEGLKMCNTRLYHPFGVLDCINLLGSVFITLTCFYVVEYVRHNRLLWGIVSVIATNTFIGILGGVLGALITFRIGYEDGLSGCETDAGVERLTERVMTRMNTIDWMNSVVLIILAVCVIVTVVLTYRTLRRRNL